MSIKRDDLTNESECDPTDQGNDYSSDPKW